MYDTYVVWFESGVYVHIYVCEYIHTSFVPLLIKVTCGGRALSVIIVTYVLALGYLYVP